MGGWFEKYLALWSCVAQRANAPVAVDQVDALASVNARATCALVYVRLTLATAEARRTSAVVLVNEIDASGAIETLMTMAVVEV